MSAEPATDHPSLQVLPYRALLRSASWDARKRMVMALFGSGRSEAGAVLRQALQDADERIRLLAAQALERLAETFRKAAQNERRRIDENPADPAPKLALARLLFERASGSGYSSEAGASTFSEAARHLSAAIAAGLAEPDATEAHLLLGQIHARLGRPADARAAYERVPESSPEYPRARLLWAETMIADGDINTARGEMRRLATLSLTPEIKNATRFWDLS